MPKPLPQQIERLHTGPLYLPKAQALALRHLLFEAAAGYAQSNPRVKLYEKIEAEVAKCWPEEALR